MARTRARLARLARRARRARLAVARRACRPSRSQCARRRRVARGETIIHTVGRGRARMPKLSDISYLAASVNFRVISL